MSSQLLLLLAVFSSATSVFSQADHETPYDLLRRYNLPIGILPKGITNYKFDKETERFAIFFKDDGCSFKLPESSTELKYESTVKGHVSLYGILDLKGVTLVTDSSESLAITQIFPLGEMLVFSNNDRHVGEYYIGSFTLSPQCGCGFHCVANTKPLALQNH